MMLAIFIFMTIAMWFCWFGLLSIALVCMFLCLALATKEFLWEIHSADYGYSMPWVQL
ncbi:hypothetical protein C031_02796 [Brucella abortus F6/05-2]|uniref:hypothetical protein n=1 Tax=Brucella abortus TaxID=235 RepID=UPI0002CE2C02|nr:hypothetical protein [Brucella abortus]ENQ02537.1 hypothetical protein C031_02796 [Brucella abortus F6/05-2]